MSRNGEFFLTYTGRQFWPIDPDPQDICIEDIAHHLSLICRFTGAPLFFYSVAQHAVLVSEITPHEKLQGLLHDSQEAFCADVSRPVKAALPDYAVVEQRLWEAVCERFDLPKEMHPSVKLADDIALITERRDLLAPTSFSWGEHLDSLTPVDGRIVPLCPQDAERLFLNRFHELYP